MFGDWFYGGSLQQINQDLAEADCIKATGSQQTTS